MQETQESWVRSLCQQDPLEEERVTHSSILAWKILWTKEPGGLQSIALQRVGHSWACRPHIVYGKGESFAENSRVYRGSPLRTVINTGMWRNSRRLVWVTWKDLSMVSQFQCHRHFWLHNKSLLWMHPVYCRMFSSILGLSSLDLIAPTSPPVSCDNQKCL